MSCLAIVIGATGGIGQACTKRLCASDDVSQVLAVSRPSLSNKFTGAEQPEKTGEKLHLVQSDFTKSSMAMVVQQALKKARAIGNPRLEIIIATGMLHHDKLQPEKRLDSLNKEQALEVMEANALVPILWLQALAPLFSSNTEARISVLSARVGSIADNQLGGWFSYRSSKAALNMMLKTASVEFAQRHPKVKLIAYHPGTTDTGLSAPFQANVPKQKLFSPDYAAECLLRVMRAQALDKRLSYVAWDGSQIAF